MVEVEGWQAEQIANQIAEMARQLKRLEDSVATLVEQVSRVAALNRRGAEQWEPRVRPYDVAHTCTCSAGWVIADDVAHRCETCQGVTGE